MHPIVPISPIFPMHPIFPMSPIPLINHHAISAEAMGAPADWKSQPLWQEVTP